MDGWKLEDVISSWEGLFFQGLCQFQISGRVNHQKHLPKFWFDSLNPEAAKVVPAVHAASTLAQGQVSCAKDQARWEEVMDAFFSKSQVFWDVMDFQTKQRFDYWLVHTLVHLILGLSPHGYGSFAFLFGFRSYPQMNQIGFKKHSTFHRFIEPSLQSSGPWRCVCDLLLMAEIRLTSWDW